MRRGSEGSGEEILEPQLLSETSDLAASRARAVAGDMVGGSFWTFLAAVLGLPAAFLGNLVIARSLGPRGFGLLASYGAVFGVASSLLNLGVSGATAQWLAERPTDSPTKEQQRILRFCVGWHSFIEGPALGVAAYFLLRTASVLVWVPAVLALVLTQCLGTAVVVLTGTARNSLAAKIALGTSLVSQAGAIAVAATTHSAQATYAATLVAAVLAPLAALIALPAEFRHNLREPLLTLRLPNGFLLYAISSCGSGLVGTLVYGRSEIFVLQANGMHEVTGLFTLATGLAGQLTVPMDSVMGPFLPAVTGLLTRDRKRTQEAAERSLRVAALLGAGTMALGATSVFVLLPVLYQSSFRQAAYPFLALAMVSCFQSLGVPVGMLLMATRSAPAALVANLTALAVDATIAIALVPVIGIWGAVLANSLSQATGTGFALWMLVHRLNVSASTVLRSVTPLAVGFVATGVGVLIELTAGGPVGRIGAVLAAGAVLVAGLRAVPTCRLSEADRDLLEKCSPRPIAAVVRVVFRVLPSR